MTELGSSVDPFEVDLLQSLARGVREHGLAERHNTLLDTGNGALDENKVVVDLTITDEATETVWERRVSIYKRRPLKQARSTYGVMVFLVISIGVEALSSASPLPMR